MSFTPTNSFSPPGWSPQGWPPPPPPFKPPVLFKDVPPYEPPPPPPRPPVGWIVGLVLSWLIILTVVALVMQKTTTRALASTRPATNPSASLQATDDFAFDMSARYELGAAELFKSTNPTLTQSMRKSLDQATRTPQEQIRAIPILAEIDSPQAAVKRIEELNQTMTGDDLHEDLRTLHTIYTKGPADVDADAARDFQRRHGWYAKLALTHGGDASSGRVAIIDHARRMVIGILIVLVIFLIVGLIGLGLGIALLILFAVRALRPLYRPARWGTPYFETFALYLLVMIFAPLALSKLVGHVTLGWSLLTIPLAVLPCLWPLLRGSSFRSLRFGLGWIRGRGVGREMLSGLIGYLAGLPLFVVAIFLADIIVKKYGVNQNPVTELLTGGPREIALLYVLACIAAPLAEETLFRGALYNALRNRVDWLVAAIVSAVIFASVHPYGWAGLPLISALGITLASLREWRGSLIASMTAHAIHNAVAVTVALLLLR